MYVCMSQAVDLVMRFLSVPEGIQRVNDSGDWLTVMILYSHWLSQCNGSYHMLCCHWLTEGTDADAVFSLVL